MPGSSLDGIRVLVVEDDPRVARLLFRALSEEGCVVETVADGQAALQRLRQGALDVCILDVLWPGLGGFEVLEQARGAGVKTPILLLTARDAVRDRVHGLNLGADDYLVKPFALAELMARL